MNYPPLAKSVVASGGNRWMGLDPAGLSGLAVANMLGGRLACSRRRFENLYSGSGGSRPGQSGG